MEAKYFQIDFKYGEEPVGQKLFRYPEQQPEAEQFCKDVKANRGLVNIRIVNRKEDGEC